MERNANSRSPWNRHGCGWQEHFGSPWASMAMLVWVPPSVSRGSHVDSGCFIFKPVYSCKTINPTKMADKRRSKSKRVDVKTRCAHKSVSFRRERATLGQSCPSALAALKQRKGACGVDVGRASLFLNGAANESRRLCTVPSRI